VACSVLPGPDDAAAARPLRAASRLLGTQGFQQPDPTAAGCLLLDPKQHSDRATEGSGWLLIRTARTDDAPESRDPGAASAAREPDVVLR
jgi:hypothetical protein